MQRSPMHGTTDAGLRQLLDEFITVDRQSRQPEPDREQVPGMDPIITPYGKLDLFHPGERVPVDGGYSLALASHLLGARQLMDADGGGDVSHVVLESGRDDPVIPVPAPRVPVPRVAGKPVQRHQFHPLGQKSVIGDGHAAFSGSYGFVSIEGEASYSGGSLSASPPGIAGAAPPGSRESMRGVLHNPQSVFRGEPVHLIHTHH